MFEVAASEPPPELSPDEHLALTAWRALRSGDGGLDWAGLPLVAAWLGADDLDALMHRLLVLKSWHPPSDDEDK